MTQLTTCVVAETSSGVSVKESGAFASLLRREESHRWMNFLQIIAAHLQRQMRQIDDASTKNTLRQACEQVQALGVLQQLLGEPLVQVTVGLKDVVPRLSSAIDTLVLLPQGFVLTTRFEPSVLELQISSLRMRLLALSLTELLVNVAKHAFDARKNQVSFSMAQVDTFLVCSIVDHGPGLGNDIARVGSEGLDLVSALTSVIEGKCRWVCGKDGTYAEIRIPLQILSAGLAFD